MQGSLALRAHGAWSLQIFQKCCYDPPVGRAERGVEDDVRLFRFCPRCSPPPLFALIPTPHKAPPPKS